MKAEDFHGGGKHKTVHKILNGHAKRKIKIKCKKMEKPLMSKMTETITKGHF